MENYRVLYPAIKLERALPGNITDKDMPLFEGTLQSSTKEIYYQEIKNVTVNNELFIKHFFQIRNESFGDVWQRKVYRRPAYLLKSWIKNALRKSKKIDRCVWIFDQFSTGGYGHWITDICPRLWIANQQIDIAVPLLIPRYLLEKYPFGADLLKAFGREVITFEENEVVHIEKMHFVSQAGGFLNYHPDVLKQSSAQIKDFYYDPNYVFDFNTVYISRKHSGKRYITNESEFDDLLTKAGIKILHLEDISVYDEVNIFSRIKTIISIHGAGFCNMVYMPDQSKIIEIRHSHSTQMLYFFINMASAMDFKYYYLLGQPECSEHEENTLRPEDLSLKLDVNNLEKLLNELHLI